jgi:hypothetical protein
VIAVGSTSLAGPTPSVSATGTATNPAPFKNDDSGGSASGAGSLAFLIIAGMLVVSVLLFWAMNRSLKRVRRNLGGDPLPRRRGSRPRRTIPVRDAPRPPQDDLP